MKNSAAARIRLTVAELFIGTAMFIVTLPKPSLVSLHWRSTVWFMSNSSLNWFAYLFPLSPAKDQQWRNHSHAIFFEEKVKYGHRFSAPSPNTTKPWSGSISSHHSLQSFKGRTHGATSGGSLFLYYFEITWGEKIVSPPYPLVVTSEAENGL